MRLCDRPLRHANVLVRKIPVFTVLPIDTIDADNGQ